MFSEQRCKPREGEHGSEGYRIDLMIKDRNERWITAIINKAGAAVA